MIHVIHLIMDSRRWYSNADKNGNIIDWSDLDVDMYDNAEKAEEGHKEMIEKWKNK